MVYALRVPHVSPSALRKESALLALISCSATLAACLPLQTWPRMCLWRKAVMQLRRPFAPAFKKQIINVSNTIDKHIDTSVPTDLPCVRACSMVYKCRELRNHVIAQSSIAIVMSTESKRGHGSIVPHWRCAGATNVVHKHVVQYALHCAS
jgi:hypothetical protein